MSSKRVTYHKGEIRVTYYEVEIRCMLCSRLIDACGLDHVPPHPVTVEELDTLRRPQFLCPHCGGSLVFGDETEKVRVTNDPAYWKSLCEDDRPRRGRPPLWLVAQRQKGLA